MGRRAKNGNCCIVLSDWDADPNAAAPRAEVLRLSKGPPAGLKRIQLL